MHGPNGKGGGESAAADMYKVTSLIQSSECSHRVIALSAADAQRSVVGAPEHYILKDFETWGGYFAPGKLLVKVLNVAFGNYPLFQVVMEEKVKFYRDQFLLDQEDAEFEVQKRLADGDWDLWKEMVAEVWKRGGKEVAINMLLQDFIRKCLDHWALYNLPEETTDRLTKLIHLSYQRKLYRYGTGYFDGGRAKVLSSMVPVTLSATRFQRMSMLASEIIMAAFPYMSSSKAFNNTASMTVARYRKGTLLAHCMRKVWWVTKRGVFHMVMWGGSAVGGAVVAAYWYPCHVRILDNIGLLIGALAGELVASSLCNTFDGFIEPFPISDDDEALVVT